MTTSIRWECPLDGWMKLNVDGSNSISTNKAGAGSWIGNPNGGWVRGFKRFLWEASNILAEAFSLRDGLRLARELGVMYLNTELDAKILYDLLWVILIKIMY